MEKNATPNLCVDLDVKQNAEMMSAPEIREKIQRGLDDVEAGRVRDIEDIARK